MNPVRTDPGLPVVRVDRVDPLVLACAVCDWTPACCWPADSTSKLLWAVIDHWWNAGHGQETARCPDRIEGVPGLIRVECEDPLVVSCAKCGGVTQAWGYDPLELLPWKVIEHLLTEHWDGAHDLTLLDGQEEP